MGKTSLQKSWAADMHDWARSLQGGYRRLIWQGPPPAIYLLDCSCIIPAWSDGWHLWLYIGATLRVRVLQVIIQSLAAAPSIVAPSTTAPATSSSTPATSTPSPATLGPGRRLDLLDWRGAPPYTWQQEIKAIPMERHEWSETAFGSSSQSTCKQYCKRSSIILVQSP